ncbi:MAG: PQQ-binding-like beta-propeller repeat protein [Pseudomonadota bacterium]
MGAAGEHANAGILFDIDIEKDVPVPAAAGHLDRRLARRGDAHWKIPLGPAHIETVRRVDEDRLYVALRKDTDKLENLDHFVLAIDTGEILWRQPRNADEYRLLFATADVLLFTRTDTKGRQRLLALDAGRGTERWSAAVRSLKKAPPQQPVIVPGAGLVLLTDTRKRSVSALAIDSGDTVWQRPLSPEGNDPEGNDIRSLLTDGAALLDPNGGLAAVSTRDGLSLWSIDIDSATRTRAQFDSGEIFTVDGGDRLIAVSMTSGETVWRTALPPGIASSNIYPYDNRVYVRATGGGKHWLLAFDRSDGRTLWSHRTEAASLSNILHVGDSVFHASGSTVFRLDTRTGELRYSVAITDTGQSYPVRLRQLPDHIAYIGELVIAGIEPDSGRIKFRHGMSPVSAAASLNAIAAASPRLQQQLGQQSESSFQTGQSQQFQNMANRYHRQAQSYRTQAFMAQSAGLDTNADSARFNAMRAESSARIASNQARSMAAVEMSLSIMNLAVQLNEMWRAAGVKALIDRYSLFRDTILDSYAVAENATYVYRPHSRFRSGDDHFIGVEIVNLETGGSRFNYLSAHYQDYGLWNLIDFERRLVIHHGIGLDSDDFIFSDERKKNSRAPGIRTVQPYLMAVPVRLP